MLQIQNQFKVITRCILVLSIYPLIISCSPKWVNKETGEKSYFYPKLPHKYEECRHIYDACIGRYCGRDVFRDYNGHGSPYPNANGESYELYHKRGIRLPPPCKQSVSRPGGKCDEARISAECKDRLAREAGWIKIHRSGVVE